MYLALRYLTVNGLYEVPPAVAVDLVEFGYATLIGAASPRPSLYTLGFPTNHHKGGTVTRWLTVAVVVLAVGVGSLSFAQQDDAHMGTWKQNFEKSKSTPAPTNPRPQSVTRIYEPFEGKGVKATFITITADGKKITSSYSAHFDGKDYPYTYSGTEGNLTHIALKRVDRYTWEAVNKGKGTVMNVGTNTVSKDGKTLTYTSKGTNAQGQPTTAVQVFEKQ